MLSLKANGKQKHLKDEFADVTLNELAKAYEFIQGLSPEMKRYLLTDSDAEMDDGQVFEYMISWIELFSNFTKDELRLVPMKGNDYSSLSIDWLYGHCEKFLHQPESYLQLPEFKHKGVTYKLMEPLKTIGGAELLFGNANYRQFMLANQLAQMADKGKKKASIQSLTQLFALLYSDGDDSSEGVVKRSKIFEDVNALYGWSAYFFFVELVEKYSDYFRLSTTKSQPARGQRLRAKQLLRRSLSKTIFGKLLPSKWLKREFLILEM